MHGMTESAAVQRIKQQVLQRYRHRPTGKAYVLILEIGGACELEGIDRRCIHQSRETLNNKEIWERLP